ncbi:MAG: secretin N-terminal domain-containing protein [Nevskiales bacterium]
MLLAPVATNAAAESAVLEVIELRHRTPEELLPVVQDALAPDGSASAHANKLIIRARPAQIRELRALLETLDVAARQLMITVRQLREGEEHEREAQISGRVEVGYGEIVLPDEQGRARRPRLRVQDEHRRNRAGDTQNLRVLEGYEGTIYIGQTLPYVQRQYLPNGQFVETVQMQEVRTGFVVRPRLQGDQVLLEISPRQERPAGGGRIERSGTTTTVSGPLGEWLDLSGVVDTTSESSSGILAAGRRQGTGQSKVMVKVELAP